MYRESILITGAAGFIGTNLIKFFPKQYDIIGIDNFDSYYSVLLKKKNLEASLKSPHFYFYNIDVRDTRNLKAIIELHKITIVIHLAARPGVRASFLSSKEYYNNNVMNTKKLLALCTQYKFIQKIIFASSSSIYGDDNNLPWKESLTDLAPLSPYSKGKLECEEIGKEFSNKTNKTFIALRFFSVYGAYMRPDLVIDKFTNNILKQKPIYIYGDGSSKRDYTHILDIVNSIILSMNFCSSKFEIFNVGSQQPVSLNQIIKKIELLTGIMSIRNYTEKFIGEPDITFADITKSKALLGFQPSIHLDDGLKNYIEWKKSS